MTASAVAAAAVVALLALGAVLARRRLSRHPAARALEIVDRALLARDAGVAIVRAREQLLLVGWGRDGVQLVAHIESEPTP